MHKKFFNDSYIFTILMHNYFLPRYKIKYQNKTFLKIFSENFLFANWMTLIFSM